MPLFIQKPIFWNSKSYIQPAGEKATGGFPKEHGYGHEEWNNSPRLHWEQEGQRYRVFHTESVGLAPLSDNVGQTFVFMTSSHDRTQQLVGVAANAMGMMDERYKRQRLALCKRLNLSGLWSNAWDVPVVREKHGNSVEKFKALWEKDLHWIPNWICPDDHFLWLTEPVSLDAVQIIGKARFLGMFSSYTGLDLATALRLMYAIPTMQRNERWLRIVDAIQSAPDEPVSVAEADPGREPVTDMLTQVTARRGQGQFRASVMALWENACAVTGLNLPTALRASHVKPWAKATGRERLDSDNGLILSANLDALFDCGLISFDDDGEMLVSSQLSEAHRAYFGIPAPLRRLPSAVLQGYLAYHRSERFLR